MWWVYGHFKYFNSFSAVTVARRQIRCQTLTFKDGPCAERGKEGTWLRAKETVKTNLSKYVKINLKLLVKHNSCPHLKGQQRRGRIIIQTVYWRRLARGDKEQTGCLSDFCASMIDRCGHLSACQGSVYWSISRWNAAVSKSRCQLCKAKML